MGNTQRSFLAIGYPFWRTFPSPFSFYLKGKTDLSDHTNAVYYLTGPEALSLTDNAQQLSESLGYEVRETPIAIDAMRENLQKAGVEEWQIKGIFAQYAVIASGHAVDVTEEVRRLTGQNPRSFLQFVHDHRENLIGRERDASAAL
ncbi:MAG TPA: hypothetical protein VFN35_35295 [Ktedonobacteraceae bacterium]|nr:hypothetical protein [Ktedonobacteraceae bacterium]